MITKTSSPTSSTSTATPVVTALNQVLADTYALMVNSHHAHWNVEGPGFFSLHEAFEEHYKALFEAVDELAERIRALDAYAIGGLEQFAKLSGIDEFTAPRTANDYVAGLVVAHEKAVVDLVRLRDLAGDSGDLETQDIAIGRLQWHQKTLWMLKSYLK